MTESDAAERAHRAASAEQAFEETDAGHYAIKPTVFDATAKVRADGGRAAFTVEVTVPLLDAVTDDHVAPVVEDGWFDTLALRIEDVGGALRGSDDPEIDITREAEHAIVAFEISDLDAKRGAENAVAAVQYVEGTYVEGIIPGYDYTEPVTHLLQRAADTAGGSRSGTPL